MALKRPSPLPLLLPRSPSPPPPTPSAALCWGSRRSGPRGQARLTPPPNRSNSRDLRGKHKIRDSSAGNPCSAQERYGQAWPTSTHLWVSPPPPSPSHFTPPPPFVLSHPMPCPSLPPSSCSFMLNERIDEVANSEQIIRNSS